MFTAPQGRMSFPGVQRILQCTASCTHGTSPSVLTITMAPQPNTIGVGGDLVLWYAGARIVFRDCKVDSASFERTAQGLIWRVSLWDRRWKWKDDNGCGQISGQYNIWRDDFTLRSGEEDELQSGGKTINTEKTPRELAELCLNAMGEYKFDVSALPEEPRPPVDWDYANPARALDELCGELGCRVTIRLSDNAVVIVRVGQGRMLPGSPLLDDSLTIDPPEIPDKIAIVCGPSEYQVDFFLEAVGLDYGTVKDGPGVTLSENILKPIDKLSYRPANGWSEADMPYFMSVGTGNIAGSGPEDVTGLRAMAQKSVFKYYRIRFPVGIPGYEGDEGDELIRIREQIEIDDVQIKMHNVNGQSEPMPAFVFGVWFPERGDLNNTEPKLTPFPGAPPKKLFNTQQLWTPLITGGYTIDMARGLVIFDNHVYRNTHADAAEAGKKPAEMTVGQAHLILRCKCVVRDKKTRAVHRYVRERVTGANFGTGTRYVRHEEIVHIHLPTYDKESYASLPNGKWLIKYKMYTNQDECDEICDYYLDALMQEYQVAQPQSREYPGLLPVDLDGAIQHVMYVINGEGCKTTVSRNNELLDYTLPFKDRRRIDWAAEQAKTKKPTTTVLERAQKRRAARRERLK